MRNPVGDKGLGIAEALRSVENLSDTQFPSDVDGFHELWWIADNTDFLTDPEEGYYILDLHEFLEKNYSKSLLGFFYESYDALPHFEREREDGVPFLSRFRSGGFRITRNKQ